MIRYIKIRKYERGLIYRDKEFQKVLRPGRHLIFNPLFRVKIEVVSVRELHRFVTERVRELTSGQQNPTARQDNLSADFGLF